MGCGCKKTTVRPKIVPKVTTNNTVSVTVKKV